MSNGVQIDRSWNCGHFGLCIVLETSICFLKTCWDVGFLDFPVIFCQNGCKVLSIRAAPAGWGDSVAPVILNDIELQDRQARLRELRRHSHRTLLV